MPVLEVPSQCGASARRCVMRVCILHFGDNTEESPSAIPKGCPGPSAAVGVLITAPLRLEKTSKITTIHPTPPCLLNHVLKCHISTFLNPSRNGDPTTALGSLVQCLATTPYLPPQDRASFPMPGGKCPCCLPRGPSWGAPQLGSPSAVETGASRRENTGFVVVLLWRVSVGVMGEAGSLPRGALGEKEGLLLGGRSSSSAWDRGPPAWGPPRATKEHSPAWPCRGRLRARWHG